MNDVPITPERPQPFDFVGALVRASMRSFAHDDPFAAQLGGERVIGGTAPAHVVARRRAANKAARIARRANRRSAR